jgi:hypothetical protein
MPSLSFPDSIFLVFRFLVLGVVMGVFLDGVFLFGVEGSSLLFSISLILRLVWRSDLRYLLGVLGSACSLFLLGSSYLVTPVPLVLLIVFSLVVFLPGYIELAPFLLARSN